MEVHAILPTKCKKTRNVREFLCKKDVGDVVFMKSMKKLILECNARDLYEREESDHAEHVNHKRNILDIIDTITIISATNSTILQMDWEKFGQFESRFNPNNLNTSSKLNVDMLRTIMQTNLSDYLMNIPVFQGLSNSKLELLTRFCHYSIEKNGSVICREGDRGEEVFILLSGEVKVEAMVSKRMVELFEEGVLSPLENSSSEQQQQNDNETHKRKGSVNYKCDYDGKNQNSKETNGQKCLIRRRQTLVKAGHNCRREKIEKLASKKSDQSDSTLRRLSSRLDTPSPDHTVELARFKPGDYFGEISTFIELPRAATVTATSNVLMVSISKQSFRTICKISPGLEKDIESIVKHHTLHTLLQTKSPFLEVISTDDAKRMADLSTIRTIEAGETVFEEGDEADDFHFVCSGQLSVLKTKNNIDGIEKKKVRIGTLYSGDYFGEMALLNDTKRLATIIATSTTVLVSITRANFRTCFQETPQLISEFVVRMKGMRVDLKSLLDYSKSRAAFSEFLDTIGCHYLNCYEAIIAFEKDSQMGKARTIIDEFIREGAPHFIDIDLTIDNGSIENRETFNTLRSHLETRLEKDLLPRFKATSTFETLRRRMRTYDEMTSSFLHEMIVNILL